MTPMHLSDDELREWRDGALDSERDRIVAHLGACESCSRRYAAIFRARPLDTAIADAPEDLRRRGYHAYAPPTASRWATIFKPAVALASAALILFVLWTIRDDSTDPVYRGGTQGVELLAPPDGATVSSDVAFEWRTDRAGTCQLRVFDLSRPEAPVIDRRAESGTQPSAAERERLSSGVEYRWFVECSSAAGESIVSPSRRFGVR
jgi:hypothetical protein